MYKSYQPSDLPVSVAKGFDAGRLDAVFLFVTDVHEGNSFTFSCGDSSFVIAPRRAGSSNGHLQIIDGNMQTIAEGLKILQHLMGLSSTRAIRTYVHEHEPLHDLGKVARMAITQALKAQGWALNIDGNIWHMERIDVRG